MGYTVSAMISFHREAKHSTEKRNISAAPTGEVAIGKDVCAICSKVKAHVAVLSALFTIYVVEYRQPCAIWIALYTGLLRSTVEQPHCFYHQRGRNTIKRMPHPREHHELCRRNRTAQAQRLFCWDKFVAVARAYKYRACGVYCISFLDTDMRQAFHHARCFLEQLLPPVFAVLFR